MVGLTLSGEPVWEAGLFRVRETREGEEFGMMEILHHWLWKWRRTWRWPLGTDSQKGNVDFSSMTSKKKMSSAKNSNEHGS